MFRHNYMRVRKFLYIQKTNFSFSKQIVKYFNILLLKLHSRTIENNIQIGSKRPEHVRRDIFPPRINFHISCPAGSGFGELEVFGGRNIRQGDCILYSYYYHCINF